MERPNDPIFNHKARLMLPDNTIAIKTIDLHTEGEPFRVIIEGFPKVLGNTILEKRKYTKENLDHLRKALMWEPRGHADMYGCILTQPVSENANFGILFIHNEGFSTMCGHGIIAITVCVLQASLIPIVSPITPLAIDTPAGLVHSFARIQNGQVESVYFQNVPSFVLSLDDTIEIENLGRVKYDVAFGGAFYAYVDAKQLNLKLTADNCKILIETGMVIKRAVMKQREITHPIEADLSFLYGVIFTDAPENESNFSRHVCIFADGEVDRSPTGTGVSAWLALCYARKEININKEVVIESILGTTFTGKVHATTKFESYDAIIPQVGGTAFITGKHKFLINPEDPLKHGFFLR